MRRVFTIITYWAVWMPTLSRGGHLQKLKMFVDGSWGKGEGTGGAVAFPLPLRWLRPCGSRGTSGHMRVLSRCCTFLNHNPFIPSPFFSRTSTDRSPRPMLIVDGLCDASWPNEVHFWYEGAKKILLGYV